MDGCGTATSDSDAMVRPGIMQCHSHMKRKVYSLKALP